MKWLVLGVLVCLAGYGEGGALKCTPGSKDSSCSEEVQSKDPANQIPTDETKETADVQAECLAGTEWNSNCHKCTCSEKGLAECVKQEECKQEVPGDPIKCKPITHFRRGCHSCMCLDDGRILCSMTCPDSSDIKDQLPQGKECAPGTTWKSQCNDCGCTQNGEYFCTKKNCSEEDDGTEKKCAPDSRWRLDCNTCWCVDGNAACTAMGCIPGPTDKKDEQPQGKDELPQGIECAPGTTWKSQCNDCGCTQKGEYYCTRKDCLSEENKREKKCAPGSRWKLECNDCWCDDGSAVCHQMGCISGPPDMYDLPKGKDDSSIELPQGKECAPGTTWKSQCNDCGCTQNGEYFCTRKTCLPDEKGREMKCAPGSRWRYECNTCWCSDGVAACTQKGCDTFQLAITVEKEGNNLVNAEVPAANSTISRKTRGVAQTAPKACQAGQEFRMDCNTCLCNNEGEDFSCTRNDCNAQNNNHASASVRTKRDAPTSEKVVMECVPGSVFDKDCNVCRCTNDGGHAVCTNKRCSTPAKTEEDDATAAPEQDPNFRCDPGEQFKRGCKDCSCSADGKSVFCTVRFCDQDITPPPSS